MGSNPVAHSTWHDRDGGGVKDVNQREYRLDVTEVENGHVAKVSKTNANAKQFVVFIPKEETLGSRSGSCTCGVPATEGIPCRHIVVLGKSNVIHGLTRGH